MTDERAALIEALGMERPCCTAAAAAAEVLKRRDIQVAAAELVADAERAVEMERRRREAPIPVSG